MDFGIIFEPHIILTSTSLLHRSLLRYCKNIWLFLSGIKSLPNQHRVIPIRRFFYPSQLFIIEFSIGVHQFRQNPCALHYFHFMINNIITGEIFEGIWTLFVPGTKKLSKKLVITSIRWFVNPPDLTHRSISPGSVFRFFLQILQNKCFAQKKIPGTYRTMCYLKSKSVLGYMVFDEIHVPQTQSRLLGSSRWLPIVIIT